MITVVTDAYSDLDLQDPGSYYGGFKAARITRFGVAERMLSHPVTGEYRGSSFDFSIADDLSLRQQLAGSTDRYWTEPLAVRMTTRANRAALGLPYTVFVGPIIDAQPSSPLGWDVTLGDIVSQGLLSDEMQVPWRMIGDGMLHLLSYVSEDLDRQAPEPIIYGEHFRIPEVTPPSQHGFMVVPTYLGIESLGGSGADHHVWMLAGHAVAGIPDVNVVDEDGNYTTVLPDEGTDWLIPHHGGFTAEFGTNYRDIRSSTYGVDRRYALIYGLVGATNPDLVANGELTLAVSVQGAEDVGDGFGAVILDRVLQYRHWLVNFVANAGPASYQAGYWLANPTWNLFDVSVGIVDEGSFLDAAAIGALRLPPEALSGSPADAGYIGAAVLRERVSVRKLLANWNRSCGLRVGVTNKGQLRAVMLHPTQAAKDAAPLLTDAYEIVRGSYRTAVDWAGQANRIPFVADYSEVLGRWETVDVAAADDAIHNYGRVMLGETREYPYAPGITAAYHLARLEVLVFKHPPRVVSLEGSITSEIAALELGDYVRSKHFAAVATSPDQPRLGQIVRHAINVGARRAQVDILDCEDLIDYDADVSQIGSGATGSPQNETCETAIVVTEAEAAAAYSIELDTEQHWLDPVTGFGGSGEAHHAAWWSYTPTSFQTGHVTTGTSDYDTQLAVFTGSCGALELVAFNDNDGVMQTSFLELTSLLPGTTYYFLACGYGAADSGRLVFTLYAAEP